MGEERRERIEEGRGKTESGKPKPKNGVILTSEARKDLRKIKDFVSKYFEILRRWKQQASRSSE